MSVFGKTTAFGAPQAKMSFTQDGKQHTLIFKLSPIRDKENTFYVEIEGDEGLKDLDLEGFDKQAITLNRANGKDFWDFIKKVLKKNKLEGLKPQTQESEPEENTEDNTDEEEYIDTRLHLEAYDENENSKAPKAPIVEVTLDIIQDDAGKFSVSIGTNSKNVPEKVTKRENLTKQALENEIEQWPTGRGLVYTEEAEEQIIDLLDSIEETAQKQEATASIKVQLEKVQGSKGLEVNLVSIRGTSVKAADILGTLVESDEFVDSMPDGISSYEIYEEDDDYNVDPIEDFPVADSTCNTCQFLYTLALPLYVELLDPASYATDESDNIASDFRANLADQLDLFKASCIDAGLNTVTTLPVTITINPNSETAEEYAARIQQQTESYNSIAELYLTNLDEETADAIQELLDEMNDLCRDLVAELQGLEPQIEEEVVEETIEDEEEVPELVSIEEEN